MQTDWMPYSKDEEETNDIEDKILENNEPE